ncbi:MAG: hypothetical protein U0167_10105 [bacterium]
MTVRNAISRRSTALLAVLALVAAVVSAGAPPQIKAPAVQSPHGASFKQDCAMCHKPDAWTPAKISSKFDHAKYGFALDGAHKNAPCLQCHLNLEFTSTKGSKCMDCHQDVHLGEMGPDCARCHSTRDFIDRSEAMRTHRSSSFPLTGAHLTVDCASCHKPVGASAMQFINTPTTCDGCHMAQYRATTSPNHQTAGFPTDCATCHSTSMWAAGAFDHSTTGFPLTGAHRTAECAACHPGNKFTPISTECVSCHRSNYDATTNPSHAAVGFPTDCARCHGTAGWDGASFDHSVTGFALTGAHRTQTCQACHGNGPFTPISPDCVSCHRPQYDSTTDPNHVALGFPTACANCHNTTTWSGATFDHASTGFPLTGAHTSVACQTCHVPSAPPPQPACVSCHRPQYDGTTDPPHASVGFSTDCVICHNTNSWSGASFNHASTGFPLTGAHTSVACQTCHVPSAPPPQPACVSCHRPQYDGTTDPPHASVGFSTDCVSCHNTNSWSGASFNHATTGFPLTGAHTTVACQTCHVPSAPPPQPACVSCHRAAYDATTDPNHAAAGFSTDCASCHNTNSWSGATFDHDATFFPIYSGSHAGRWTACSDCHTTSTNYAVFECILCHAHSNQADVNSHHQGVNGYSYNSAACYNCHPRGRAG